MGPSVGLDAVAKRKIPEPVPSGKRRRSVRTPETLYSQYTACAS